MLKGICKFSALVALIAYPILFWIWKSYGFPIDVMACQHTGTAGQCDNYAPEHIYLFVFGKIGEVFSDSAFITALATVLLAFITGGLVWVGYRQIQTTRAQLRAYISVEPGQTLTQNKRRKTVFEFRPVVVNNGLTPANDVRIISMIEKVAPLRPETFNYVIAPVAGPISVTTISPRQSRFHTRLINRRLTLSEMKELLRGKQCIHVWGVVRYLDIFKKPQYTNFSFLIFLTTKRSQVVWNNTEYFNDAS